MADTLRFPLYVFRAAGKPGIVFQERDGEKHLPLFTSAENASRYRKFESMNVQIARLSTPSELRELLLTQRDDSGEFKIMLDPNYADAGYGCSIH